VPADLRGDGGLRVECVSPVEQAVQAVPIAPVTHVEHVKEAEAVEEPDFRPSSLAFHASLSKETRMEQGIFFTPKKARDRLFACLEALSVRPRRIVEPSFGSGEFLEDAAERYPDAEIVGVEKNQEMVEAFRKQQKRKKANRMTLHHQDFLTWSGRADLIIGNPPYFTITWSAEEKKKKAAAYAEAMIGRPNIYILFLYHCLTKHLEPDGYLAFILPTSLYHCSYYQPLRTYLAEKTTICHLETLDKPGFYQTGQDTMLIVLQNRKRNDDYLVPSPTGFFLNPFYRELAEMMKGTTTMAALGLGVKTGSIVWNQVKDHLSDDTGTLLLYASNLKDGELIFPPLRGGKKQYVTGMTKPTLSGPVILVDRGYGNALRFHFVYTERTDFYAENHINVIYPRTPEAVGALHRVMASVQDERTAQWIRWCIPNGSMSSTDVETLLPIF